MPTASLLKSAYPNPASGKVNIGFQIDSSARTSLKIYNIAGELVRTLVDSRLSSGDYDLRWDGRDGRNRAIPSGVYLYQLDTGSQKATGRLTIIRYGPGDRTGNDDQTKRARRSAGPFKFTAAGS